MNAESAGAVSGVPRPDLLDEIVFPKVALVPAGKGDPPEIVQRGKKLVVTPGAGLRVKNRIFRSSISGRFDNDNGSGTETRIRWEEKFARGGVGAIISSFVPVQMDGRILVNYATIHHNDTIPFWTKLIERVHKAGSKYIIQLSHGGRQRDVAGILNASTISRSATDKTDSFHGLLSQRMTDEELKEIIDSFAQGARRAKEAGADGVELHASHGYLFTQFLSSAINNYPSDHRYGGGIERRAQFLLDVIERIREEVGWDFHVQVKLNIIDRNRALWPLERDDGNTVEENLAVFRMAENAGVNGLHVSGGSTFPHPLVPPGGFPADELAGTYGVMAAVGTRSFLNLVLFRYPLLRPVFKWIWNRTKTEFPVEGVTADLSKLVRDEAAARAQRRGEPASILPVLNTGGYQDRRVIRDVFERGCCDAVAIARPLIANNDLVNEVFMKDRDLPEKPCTFCNRCLVNAIANPLACYDQRRFKSRKEMLDEAESVFDVNLPAREVPSMTIVGEQRTRHLKGELVDNVYATPVELAVWANWKRYLKWALVLLILLALIFIVARFTRDRPVTYKDEPSHYKYGSIGSEPGGGNPFNPVGGLLPPYQVFAILPELYADKYPDGYETFGLIFEKKPDGQKNDLPIGVSRRQRLGIDLVGLNCAVCHVGTLRTSPNAPAQIVLGMPSHQLDLQGLFEFILSATLNDRFTGANVVGHVERKFGKLNPIDRALLANVTVPMIRERTQQLRTQTGVLFPMGLGVRPGFGEGWGKDEQGQNANDREARRLAALKFRWGSGRVDTFNPYKAVQFRWPLDRLSELERAAASDYPSLWNQAPRDGLHLHWDGNNPSLAERNLSAGLGAGITPVTVDHQAVERVAQFIRTMPAPEWPREMPVDRDAAFRGKGYYEQSCAGCHDFGARHLGEVVPLDEIGTDPSRWLSYTPVFAGQQNTLFPDSKYRFRHFRKTTGYVNQPLDGIWARAPYLHNGSVPTLADLLERPDKRPKKFYRGDDVYDPVRVGFRSNVASAHGREFFEYDTTLPGNHNGGHTYGVDLPAEAKRDLVEYLKLL